MIILFLTIIYDKLSANRDVRDIMTGKMRKDIPVWKMLGTGALIFGLGDCGVFSRLSALMFVVLFLFIGLYDNYKRIIG